MTRTWSRQWTGDLTTNGTRRVSWRQSFALNASSLRPLYLRRRTTMKAFRKCPLLLLLIMCGGCTSLYVDRHVADFEQYDCFTAVDLPVDAEPGELKGKALAVSGMQTPIDGSSSSATDFLHSFWTSMAAPIVTGFPVALTVTNESRIPRCRALTLSTAVF